MEFDIRFEHPKGICIYIYTSLYYLLSNIDRPVLWYLSYVLLPKISSSSSSCRAGSTDIPEPLLPLLPIVYRSR